MHRADVDRENRLLRVERRYTGGMLVVVDALDAMPPRIDTPILVPAARGGYIDIEPFLVPRMDTALRAAGLEHRRIYDCRHTCATWAIEDCVSLWELPTITGTSVVQIEDTYARWLKRTNAGRCVHPSTPMTFEAMTVGLLPRIAAPRVR